MADTLQSRPIRLPNMSFYIILLSFTKNFYESFSALVKGLMQGSLGNDNALIHLMGLAMSWGMRICPQMDESISITKNISLKLEHRLGGFGGRKTPDRCCM